MPWLILMSHVILKPQQNLSAFIRQHVPMYNEKHLQWNDRCNLNQVDTIYSKDHDFGMCTMIAAAAASVMVVDIEGLDGWS